MSIQDYSVFTNKTMYFGLCNELEVWSRGRTSRGEYFFQKINIFDKSKNHSAQESDGANFIIQTRHQSFPIDFKTNFV